MEGWGPGCRSRIGILTKVFTPELVDAAVAKHGRGELRRRLLPARLVVYFVLGLCLFARESYEEVIRMLTSGIPGSRALARVNRSSLCRARVRLGEELLETVFRQVAGPLAVPETPGAWWRGLRLLALDGTQFDVPDSVGNGDTFDGPSTGGTPFGFPQVRAAVLAEIGTHAILDAGPGGPLRSRTPKAVRQELWALLAVHQAVSRFAHDAAASGPVLDADRLSYLRCVRIARRSVPSQHGTSRRTLTSAWKEAIQEARSRLLPPRSGRDRPRAIKKPMRWPILRARSGRSKVAPGRWAHNQTTKQRKHRGAGKPVPRAQPP
ncbi:transposase domain-containing protein [Streptomyces tubercidicus]|uniref:transposase domain-containing protein n=1 Tax=Streptomyces tubercidicus TaxID=47759 RepID=UPI0034667A6D